MQGWIRGAAGAFLAAALAAGCASKDPAYSDCDLPWDVAHASFPRPMLDSSTLRLVPFVENYHNAPDGLASSFVPVGMIIESAGKPSTEYGIAPFRRACVFMRLNRGADNKPSDGGEGLVISEDGRSRRKFAMNLTGHLIEHQFSWACWTRDKGNQECLDSATAARADSLARTRQFPNDEDLRAAQAKLWADAILAEGGPWFSCATAGCCRLKP